MEPVFDVEYCFIDEMTVRAAVVFGWHTSFLLVIAGFFRIADIFVGIWEIPLCVNILSAVVPSVYSYVIYAEKKLYKTSLMF
ncbi:MAG: hypothetical protein LUE96_05800 [Lachnospiraceae bacterium]|nr:hypothetical protein [Lachnospiraceae bacterium]